jgi:hypothetical protein
MGDDDLAHVTAEHITMTLHWRISLKVHIQLEKIFILQLEGVSPQPGEFN